MKTFKEYIQESTDNLNKYKVIVGTSVGNKIGTFSVLKKLVSDRNFRRLWERSTGDYLSKAGTRKGFRDMQGKWSLINHIDTNKTLASLLNSDLYNKGISLINVIDQRIDRELVKSKVGISTATMTDVLTYFIIKNWELDLKNGSMKDIIKNCINKGNKGELLAIQFFQKNGYEVIELDQDTEKHIDISGIDFYIEKDGLRQSVQVKTNKKFYNDKDIIADLIVDVDVKTKRISVRKNSINR